MFKSLFRKLTVFASLVALTLVVVGSATETSAQMRLPDLGSLGNAVNVQIKVGEITLESIDFQRQTASLSIGLDVANGLIPVSLKDFDYRLRLADRDLIEGTHQGTLKVGGRQASRVNLPVTVHLRSIPNVVWSAFTNRGRLSYDLDSAFTLPLFITEKRFDQSFSGEVPLRSVVDAASILRARQVSEGRSSRTSTSIWDMLPW
ncbi:MAG TPA: LEA type 2 family protein [Pyrinomonadaceae bacterium]|nr:LEA type 2 family protein [Pyrinomonadaceae bacterium]